MDTHAHGIVTVLRPRGELIGTDETLTLEQAGIGLIEQGLRKLVVDLSEVPFMNSLGIGVLAQFHIKLRRRGGVLALVAPALDAGHRSHVFQTLETTKLNTIIPVRETEDAAVEAAISGEAP